MNRFYRINHNSELKVSAERVFVWWVLSIAL